MYGMLHLTCALNAAALRRPDESAEHQAEATDVASRVGAGTNFGHQSFGVPNVGFWRITLAVERGEGGKVGELAGEIDPTAVRSTTRRAGFYTDLGRGLATERAHRQEAVVTDLMRRARRDAIGRDLRGMAYRMGLAAS